MARFHELYGKGDFKRVHSEASAEFQRSTKLADLERLLKLVKLRLGTIRTAQRRNFRISWGTGGNSVILTYATQFAKGDAVERFNYRVVSGAPSLLGYNVNSPALLAPATPEEAATGGIAPEAPVQSEVETLVAENATTMRSACWEPAIRDRKGTLPEARVVVAVVVEPTGAVKVQATSDFAADYPGLADCVSRTVAAWQLAPRPTAIHFSIPFVFTSK